MEESFISPGRAIEIHGLPPTLKKAKPDSLAKPGLLRNSGGEWGEILVSTLAAIDGSPFPCAWTFYFYNVR